MHSLKLDVFKFIVGYLNLLLQEFSQRCLGNTWRFIVNIFDTEKLDVVAPVEAILLDNSAL